MTKPNLTGDRRRDVALFRLAVLGDLIHQDLPRGELKAALEAKAKCGWHGPSGRYMRVAAKTIQSWLTLYRRGGFDALYPKQRKDRGVPRSIPPEIATLIVDLKRERPGRSAAQITDMLVDVGRVTRADFSASSVQRLLAAEGLSGPKMEIEVPARHRFRASCVNELWQVDAVHGPKLFDPATGRRTTVKIFGLIDDRSRLVTHLRGFFRERQEDFLRTLFEAIRVRGIPRTLLLDNHGSFTGSDVKVVCAQLGIRLVYARPYDGASKGKIERFWRHLRARVLSELDLSIVEELDDLNLRLMAWVNSTYNRRAHAGIEGRTPLSVFEEEVDSVRFQSDFDALSEKFIAHAQRSVRRDATCSFGGRVLEVPQHFRGSTITLHYAVMRPDVVWIEDGETRVTLRDVDEVANSKRVRIRSKPTRSSSQAQPSTGINGVEALIRRTLKAASAAPIETSTAKETSETDENGGFACNPF